MTYTVAYNAFEVALWFLIGAECFRRGMTGRARRTPATVASITFVLFSVSDLVEITTGAWWRPWWLLLWKAACIAVLLALLVRTVKAPRSKTSAAESMIDG